MHMCMFLSHSCPDFKDDEYQPLSGEAESSSESSGEEEQMEVTPIKKAKNSAAKTPTSMVKNSPALTPRSLGSSSYSLPSPITPGSSATLTEEGRESSYHDQLPWLKDENRRDKNGRSPSHPDFNPRTLFVS